MTAPMHTATALNSHHSVIVTTYGDRWYRITIDGEIRDEGPLAEGPDL